MTSKQATAAEQESAKTFYNKTADLFSVPTPVKALFESVPVITYAPNELPQRSPKAFKLPSLYIFGSRDEVAAGRPSFNPTCLRWQTFLRIAGIQHRLIASNNHASPTGILPFLIPAIINSTPDSQIPIPANKLVQFAYDQGSRIHQPHSMRNEAYQSLLDQRIRCAWLYALYLDPLNFSAVAVPRYVNSSTSNPLVRFTISRQLQAAAEAELLKHVSGGKIDVDDLYSEADKAFEALSMLLGDDEWFFQSPDSSPDADNGSAEKEDARTKGLTLFDASVFAYTHLLLDEKLGWMDKKLVRSVRRRENLVRHRNRILRRFWSDEL